MGYTTQFQGTFKLNKKLTPKLQAQLIEFANTRHGGNMDPFPNMPGFWCQWVPTSDGEGIEWDGNEKFYNYVEWLVYIIENFLQPEEYILNGTVRYRGEDFNDCGDVICENNKVTVNQLG